MEAFIVQGFIQSHRPTILSKQPGRAFSVGSQSVTLWQHDCPTHDEDGKGRIVD